MKLFLRLILLSKYNFCFVFKKQSVLPHCRICVACFLISKVLSQNIGFLTPKPISTFLYKSERRLWKESLFITTPIGVLKAFPYVQISSAGKKQDPVLSVYPWTFLTSRNKFKCQQAEPVSVNRLHANISTQEQSCTPPEVLLVPVTLFNCNLFLRKYYPCNSNALYSRGRLLKLNHLPFQIFLLSFHESENNFFLIVPLFVCLFVYRLSKWIHCPLVSSAIDSIFTFSYCFLLTEYKHLFHMYFLSEL